MADNSLFHSLNPDQLAAVRHATGPCLIIAGPGTGKTRVLTCRIAWLIQERHVPANQILAITFTNKAAEEIRHRLQDMLGLETSRAISATTFHAYGYELLKRHATILNRTSDFSIIDEHDRQDILRHHLNLNPSDVGTLSSSMSLLKQGIQQPDLSPGIIRHYEEVLQGYNAFDIDDLLWQSVRLLREHPDIALAEQQRVPWVLVDEYQDINRIQYELLRLLVPGADGNLCVIGDPDQAIYGFRGADVSFIRDFSRDFPSATCFNLKTSYRCPDRILQASQGVIHDAAAGQYLLRGLEPGIKIQISSHSSDRSEAEFVSRTIEQMIGGLSFFSFDSKLSQGQAHPDINSFRDFCVLCRLKAQMKAVEKALLDHNIPFQSIADKPFFQQSRLRPLLDFLRYAANPQNIFLRERLLRNTGLSTEKLEQLILLRKNTPLPALINTVLAAIETVAEPIPAQLRQQLDDLCQEYADRPDNFIKLLALGSGIDTLHPQAQKVTLLTMHSAKGLEFPCVFVVGCEDSIIPYRLFPGKEADDEEERRLLYVAMTRAHKMLFLSHCHKRFLFGKEYRLGRSPFLDRIEQELLEKITSGEPRKKKKSNEKQPTFF